MPAGYYALTVPSLLRKEIRLLPASRRAELDRFGAACQTSPELSGMVQTLFERMLPRAVQDERTQAQSLEALLDRLGFDRLQHEQVRADLRSGRIGLAQNRLPVSSTIEDVRAGDVTDATGGLPDSLRRKGMEALSAGSVESAERGAFAQAAVRVVGPLRAVARFEAYDPVVTGPLRILTLGGAVRLPHLTLKLDRQIPDRASARVANGWFVSASAIF